MAKKSKIAANARRQATVERYRERREALKARAIDPHCDEAERAAARAALQKLPRDASPVRVRNRDAIDGRPRAYMRTFGLSRVNFRSRALAGELPGVTKASW